MHWYFLIFSYKLTILNGLSLTTLNSKEFTLCSGSFEWGVYRQFYLGKSENLSSLRDLLLLHRALSFLIRNERPTRYMSNGLYDYEVIYMYVAACDRSAS